MMTCTLWCHHHTYYYNYYKP